MATTNEKNNVANLLNGLGINLTSSRREVFKKEIINNLSETEAKTFRRKVRKMVVAYAESICMQPANEKLIKQFTELYAKCYSVNDFTLHSICSDNMRESSKKVIEKALSICKNKLQK